MNIRQKRVLEAILKGEIPAEPAPGALAQCYQLGYITVPAWDAEVTHAGYVAALRMGIWSMSIPLKVARDGDMWSAEPEVRGPLSYERLSLAVAAAVDALNAGELRLAVEGRKDQMRLVYG